MTSGTTHRVCIERFGGELGHEYLSYYPEIWKQIPDVLSEVILQSEKGPITFAIDWSEVFDYIAYFTNEDIDLYDDSVSNDIFKVTCEVHSTENSRALHFHYLEYLLHQVFLALNLSLPGCGNLRNTVIRSDNPVLDKPFGLSSDELGLALDLSVRTGWPPISPLPLQDTWVWLQRISSTPKQVAQTNAERTLFSLLHVCLDEQTTPVRVIWLAHALEAIFDTPELGISRALRDRIFLVLEAPEQNVKQLTKMIRSFYELRSKCFRQ